MKRATATVEPGNEASIRQIASASLIGSVVEWYDFFLYGTMAALVFNAEFFPKFDPLTGTLAAFTTFAAGFITRPIGGIVFGHLGDRLGRKPMLVVTMMIMGLSTFAMGLLPSYDSIGVAAPLLLVLLRMFQGIGLGGEWGGAVLLCVEHAPQERRGWYSSWPQLGVPIGLLLSTGAVKGDQPARRRGPGLLGLAHPVPGQHRAGRDRPVHPAPDRRAPGVQGARRPRRTGPRPAPGDRPPAPEGHAARDGRPDQRVRHVQRLQRLPGDLRRHRARA